MGVYCEVHICIERDAQLPLETRLAIVELAIRHELVTRHCRLAVPDVLPPSGLLGHLAYLFGRRTRYLRTVQEGEPGPWVAERLRSLADTDEVHVSSGFPVWKGEPLTGPFVYQTTRAARTVKIVDAYRRPDERSPYQPADGVIGAFHDQIRIEAKRGLDARIAARSAFVRELKDLTGAKVICRASWS